MKIKFPFSPRPTILTGDVINAKIIVNSLNDYEFRDNKELWMFFSETRNELEEEIKKTVKNYLWPEFEISSISYRRGSIEILIVIGTVYYTISRYKSFIESIELFVSQIKNIVDRFFRRTTPVPVSVSGTWTPSGSLLVSEAFINYPQTNQNNSILIYYLLLSHFIMLIVIVWLLLINIKAI